ncbi:hypothetical protein Daura_03705 [Dactylosporangium aurantiacum]|uniref:Uncharacterized protein n=1 Tax=Dactylosporangium aurantiacum TaxID=35754 RepID=A0A9Q9IG06_9ACTN|nr:hypothetical protein [Dactylosporangium aurantiacum]MDG6100535.1 hypothetical protein [Dactylosporangium aurantiacum]UWZ55367.1 hypothetical protein Daura_03705 [Dactylosporangium aurantiacum]
MIEDALREAFAAKAGTQPPRSLDGIADVVIRNAGRVRRRRRAAVTGFAAFVVMAVAAVATFHVITPSSPGSTVAEGDTSRQTVAPEATLNSQTAPPAADKEVPAIDGQAQPSQTVHLKLSDNGTVAAAYKAKDGYLVVNTGGGSGNKQLVLQDEHNNQEVLVKKASDIAVSKGGDKVAWAQEGTMTVASRSTATPAGGSPNASPPAQGNLTQQATAEVPQTAVPVTFVGPNLVLGREAGAGFDVWYAGRAYTESWDPDVLRIFGVHPDAKSVYAEVKPIDDEKSMCLALLALDQPFKVVQRRCGLPVAAKAGGRVSPDGNWLAYPVEGLKQVAVLDLTKIFTGGAAKTWTLNVTTKTVWMNASTFVVDSGGKFRAISPTAVAGTSESLNTESEGVVLIEPLYSG